MVQDEDGVRASDWLTVCRDILEWPDGLLAGAPGGPALPDSLTVALPEYDDRLAPTYALPDPDAPDGWLLLIFFYRNKTLRNLRKQFFHICNQRKNLCAECLNLPAFFKNGFDFCKKYHDVLANVGEVNRPRVRRLRPFALKFQPSLKPS